MISAASANYTHTLAECDKTDADIIRKCQKTQKDTNGTEYAQLISLAHRQSTGALKVVWNDQRNDIWVFIKEISSDGDVSTVDVIYPFAPMPLALQSPEILRKLMLPVLAYANNETDVKYNREYAPHHLGQWPVCDLPPSKQG